MKHELSTVRRRDGSLRRRGTTSSGELAPHDAYPLEPDEGMRIRDYWDMVRRHLVLIALIVAAVTVPVTVLMLLTPDYYTAKARVEINMERPGQVGDARQGQAIVSTDPAYFNTQLQLMGGPVLLRRVIGTLDLEHDPAFQRHMGTGGRLLRRLFRLGYVGRREETPVKGAVQAPAELAEAQRLRPYVAELQRRIMIRPVMETRTAFRETRLVDLVFEHPSPHLAAAVTNAIADAFVWENRDKNSRSGATTNAYLGRRVEGLQAEIRQADEQLISYGQHNQILSLEPGQNVALERLTSLNRQLLEAENDRKLAEANYREGLRPAAASSLAAEMAKSVISDAEIRLAELRAKRAQLLVGATESWPEVKEVTQQIRALEANVENVSKRAASTAVASLETRYKQALALETTVRADFDRQRGLIHTQNQAAVNYRLIQQEIRTKQGLLDAALKRLGENDLAQADVSNNVSVLDYALVANPEEPDGPWRLQYIAAAFLLSLVAGSGAAVTRELMNHTLRSGVEVEAALELPAVGLIRSAPVHHLQRESPPAERAAWRELAEDYRRLRTSILLPVHGEVRKTWLVTSSRPHEGKTTTVINLAASLVQSGAKVLLVDADFRRPQLHTAFGLANARGLSTLLASTSPFAGVWDRVSGTHGTASDAIVQRHQPSGIYVLTAGPAASSASELLGSERMTALLASLQRSFNHVIIDSPPIASYIDSVVLGAKVDGVLLVVRASTTPLGAARYAKRLLHRAGANVWGVVLNNVEAVDALYYGYDEWDESATQATHRSRTLAHDG